MRHLLISNNLASINVYHSFTIFSICLTSLNQYIIRAKGLKLQLPLNYNGSVENNVYKELIEGMQAYMSYYEKNNIFANEKKKIDSAQGYFKDTAKYVWIAHYKYMKRFPIEHV